MDIQPENADNLQTVTACRANGITLDQTDYHGSLIVMPGTTPLPWHVKSFRELVLDDLLALTAYQPDIVLLGTGNETRRLPEDWIFSLLDNGIVIECMNGRAACGTYNMLLAEGRNALLALVMEEIK
ncbi:Mth938-like domain-containing protein [Oxalobacter paraformigenes]|uniref:Xcc1710-like domain-containing protein n=1 Tax=Oxalobacter paraformigenes TaxID=556268 RepID=C3X257_9BURK|nr:Mth938-like domain-containing protein [Oxalobacter paraformigenes]EEO27293.1 hypothetical protein OFAG_00446 [Oxalobacter paraformigenes]